eukprot:gene15239-20539_t
MAQRYTSNSLVAVPVAQGGELQINFELLSKINNVRIESGWRNHCEITYKSSKSIYLLKGDQYFILSDTNHTNDYLELYPNNSNVENQNEVTVLIPENFDLRINLRQCNLQIINKVQGDAYIECSNDITVEKLRGTKLIFNCQDGNLKITKLLEGNSSIIANTLQAKMINGDTVEINAKKAFIQAMYAEKCTIKSSGIDIGLFKGHLNAYNSNGDISIKGIDGSFNVTNAKGNINLQINGIKNRKLQNNEGCSLANALDGNITATLDPDVIGIVTCASSLAEGSSTVLSDSFELGNNKNHVTHDTKSNAFVGKVIEGYFTGKSKSSKKRPTFNNTNSSRSGKIDLVGAELQANHKIEDTENATVFGNGKYPAIGGVKLDAYGNIKLETLSWIEAIRKKYGFEENEGTIPPIAPGRTASANLEAKKLID